MKNNKGFVPAILTLGLVLIGSLVTIGISYLTNNNKIASNPRAMQCGSNECSGTNSCFPIGSPGGTNLWCCGPKKNPNHPEYDWATWGACNPGGPIATSTPTPTPKPRCVASGDYVVKCCLLYDYGKNSRCNKDSRKPLEQTLVYYGTCMTCNNSDGSIEAGECNDMGGEGLVSPGDSKCFSNPSSPTATLTPTKAPKNSPYPTLTRPVLSPTLLPTPTRVIRRFTPTPSLIPTQIVSKSTPTPTLNIIISPTEPDVGGNCVSDGKRGLGYTCVGWDSFSANSNEEACRNYAIAMDHDQAPGYPAMVQDLNYNCGNYERYTCCRPSDVEVTPVPTIDVSNQGNLKIVITLDLSSCDSCDNRDVNNPTGMFRYVNQKRYGDVETIDDSLSYTFDIKSAQGDVFEVMAGYKTTDRTNGLDHWRTFPSYIEQTNPGGNNPVLSFTIRP